MVKDVHKYYLYDTPMDTSVTQRIANDITNERFDSAVMSTHVFNLCERIRANPTAHWKEKQLEQFRKHGQYTSPQAIAEAWERNRDNGVMTHETIEFLLSGQRLANPSRIETPEIKLFIQFCDSWLLKNNYQVVAVEAPIVMPSISTGGTIDCICRRTTDKQNEIMIIDWKTMPPVVMEPGEKMCEFFLLPNCKRAKQEIQLNLYAEMIEAMTEYKVTRMILVYFDVGMDMWDKVDVPRRAEAEHYIKTLAKRYSDNLFTMAEDVKSERK